MAQVFLFDAESRLLQTRYDATHIIEYQYDLYDNPTGIVVTANLADEDTDADAMPDAWEWVFFNSLTNGPTADPNLNGKNNLWEFQNGYDPLDPDSDGDGAPNTDETTAGTDPLNPDSVFQVSGFRFQLSGRVISWSSVTNKYYRLERSTNLINGFSPLPSNILATPPLNVHTDNTAVGAGPWLYRVELE